MTNSKKILFMEWNSVEKEAMIQAFIDKGFVVDRMDFPHKTENTRYSRQLTQSITMRLIQSSYQFVFSFNYYPVIAIACQTCKIPYVSWVYDSPFIQLYSNTLFYDTNYVFQFDQAECMRLQSYGANNVFYLPMGVDVDEYDKMKLEDLSQESVERYKADVTFVGSLYTEPKQRLYDRFDSLDEYTKGYLNGIYQAQKNVYGYNFLEELLTVDLIDKLQKVAPITQNADGFEDFSWVYANYFMARKVTSIERTEILKMVSDAYDTKIFTYADTSELPNIKNMGGLDYEKCPYAFKGAKINLNITLRSIQTGIPLRAMDIMGAGGFLLTNYQADFLEHFVPNEDFVYYEDMKDLKEKIHYYLAHEEERMRIAKSGYQKVRRNHTLSKCIDYMIQKISV